MFTPETSLLYEVNEREGKSLDFTRQTRLPATESIRQELYNFIIEHSPLERKGMGFPVACIGDPNQADIEGYDEETDAIIFTNEPEYVSFRVDGTSRYIDRDTTEANLRVLLEYDSEPSQEAQEIAQQVFKAIQEAIEILEA